MKTITKEAASKMLKHESLDAFLADFSSKLQHIGDRYVIPPDSGKKTALSRLFAYLLFREPVVCVYVSGWGVWGSAENLDLFYRYRNSFHENRTLMEASVHLFDQSEKDAFVSIVCMALYFIWDAWIFDVNGNALLRISHDEWFQVWSKDEVTSEAFQTELRDYAIPLVSR